MPEFEYDFSDILDYPYTHSKFSSWCRGCHARIKVGEILYCVSKKGIKPAQWVCSTCAKNWGKRRPVPPGIWDESSWIEHLFQAIPGAQVKKVFSALAKTYHPDVGGTNEEMRRIIDACKKRQDV